MNKIEEKRSSNQSYVNKVNTLRDEINSSIEHFSNEIFYEIFDYLDGISIYEAFSNLNYYFEQLLNSSSLLFKIKLEYSTSNKIFMKNYEKILSLNKCQIFSINFRLSSLNDKILTLYPIDLSFNHLESLIVERLEPKILISFLTNLGYLRCLSSLTIETWNDFQNLNDIYRLIFALPTLKYNKFSLCGDDSSISLPMGYNNKQLSPIEHLVIGHLCKFDELSIVLSYTPQLRRLDFLDTHDNDTNLVNMLSIRLLNLTHISLRIYSMTFDDFEILIKKICSKLKYLNVTIRSDNIVYLDAIRWKKLISEYLLQLKEFYFDYYTEFGDGYRPSKYIGQSNQFSSSFWLEKQWIFISQIHMYEIIYSIRPYTKKWYEYEHGQIDNSSIQRSQSAQLELTFIFSGAEMKFLISCIKLVLKVEDIYHLDISYRKICIDALIEIIYVLPKLISLKIRSLSFPQSLNLSDKQIERFLLISNNNQITKVYLQKMNHIDEIYFLMQIFPRINSIHFNSINNINVELFIRDILLKINEDSNQYLRLLCLRVPTVDDQMIKKLEIMIHLNKLIVDYQIKRVMDHIYLQWK